MKYGVTFKVGCCFGWPLLTIHKLKSSILIFTAVNKSKVQTYTLMSRDITGWQDLCNMSKEISTIGQKNENELPLLWQMCLH